VQPKISKQMFFRSFKGVVNSLGLSVFIMILIGYCFYRSLLTDFRKGCENGNLHPGVLYANDINVLCWGATDLGDVSGEL
jgi:hypothetical protein